MSDSHPLREALAKVAEYKVQVEEVYEAARKETADREATIVLKELLKIVSEENTQIKEELSEAQEHIGEIRESLDDSDHRYKHILKQLEEAKMSQNSDDQGDGDDIAVLQRLVAQLARAQISASSDSILGMCRNTIIAFKKDVRNFLQSVENATGETNNDGELKKF